MTGDEETGRLDILARFIEDKPSGSSDSGFSLDENESRSKNMTLPAPGGGTIPILLNVLDTSSQERFRAVTSSYYRKAHGCIIVYDVTDQVSFNAVDNWMKDVKLYAKTKIVIAVVGNKSDLVEKKVVSTETAKQFCDDNAVDLFREVSAATGSEVQETFQELIKIIHNRIGGEGAAMNDSGVREGTVNLTSDPLPKTKERKPICMLLS